MKNCSKISLISFLCIALSAGMASSSVTAEVFFNMIADNDVAGVRQSLEDGFAVNEIYKDRDGEKTALLEAIRRARPEMVKTLLDCGADTELARSDDITPLIFSIMFATFPLTSDSMLERKRDALEITDILIARKADVNYLNRFNWTPLTQAVSGMDYDSALILTKKLLDAGAEVNPPMPPSGMSPLFWTIAAVYADEENTRENRVELVCLLIDAGADVNARVLPEEDTPLHGAAAADYELTEVLLDAGADKLAKNKEGKTPFDVAMSLRNFKIAALLAVKQ
jgi:ankyrin repeat protein